MTRKRRGGLKKNVAMARPPSPEKETRPPIPEITMGFYFIPLIFMNTYIYLLKIRPTLFIDLDSKVRMTIVMNCMLSILGFGVTWKLIPLVARFHLRCRLIRFDLNKRGTPRGRIQVPESLGIVVGIVFLLVAIIFYYCNTITDSNWLGDYIGALSSICLMLVLGYLSDVLDISWRVKMLLPCVAIVPLLMLYGGHTTIVVPKVLVQYVGHKVFDLGWIYKLYMCLLTLFCTNVISLNAGINGLEVGQTLAIATSVLAHNLIQIMKFGDPDYQRGHLFSIFIVQPLIATSLALFYKNWYPSSVFVGDSYKYFAGMTLTVAGIMCHSSETLLLFLFPQILNFILSVPQLVGINPCARHRLPRFDPKSGLLIGTKDGTIINFILRKYGAISEYDLSVTLLTIQAGWCYICFYIRLFVHRNGWYK